MTYTYTDSTGVDTLHQRIDLIDQQLFDLVKSRQILVGQVIAHQKDNDAAMDQYAKMQRLFSKLWSDAEKDLLNRESIDEVCGIFHRQAQTTQTDSPSLGAIRKGANVLLIGGHGAMGKYFAALFTEAGYRVESIGRHDWDLVPQMCRRADLAVLSVPIDITETLAREIGPMLPPSCLLVDLTSIKSRPMAAMLEAHEGPVMGLHPLFGPKTCRLDKQIIVATDGRNPEQCQWLIDQLRSWGAIVIRTTPAEHDDMMDVVQGLRHFATFAIGRFLYERKIDVNRTLEFSSPIYRLELGMVGRLFSQDPSLYSEIIFSSSDRRQLLVDYLASVQENIEMLRSADKKTFEKKFRKIANWFRPFSKQAMQESTYLIDKLIERF